jgi:hypothetical protein
MEGNSVELEGPETEAKPLRSSAVTHSPLETMPTGLIQDPQWLCTADSFMLLKVVGIMIKMPPWSLRTSLTFVLNHYSYTTAVTELSFLIPFYLQSVPYNTFRKLCTNLYSSL